ncbi:MAG: sugar kinase [Planctomycetota bacterium]|nr:MAG: sugar kinase [Planctomycetota bacterium]
MSLMVVGSIAFDTIETSNGIEQDLLGGSATYFSLAASKYTNLYMVGVVGKDFPQAILKNFEDRGISTKGVERKEGNTFRWWGRYSEDMNHRQTIEVELNVFEKFEPKIPTEIEEIEYLFLGNGSPQTQLSVLDQMKKPPKFTALDTMDLWIQTKRPELMEVLKRIDAIILNDEEARLLTEEYNLIKAGRMILHYGPKVVIIKKGEHGAIMVSYEGIFTTTAFPLESFLDPTGAGDSFAGGFMGYLCQQDDTSLGTLKKAILHGTVVASFTVQDFGTRALENLKKEEIENRLEEFMSLLYV